MCFSQHMSQAPLGRWQTTSRERVSMQLARFGPLLIPTAHMFLLSPSANPTKWDQLLSLGEEGLHQDVHCWNHADIWVFIFSEHMRFAGCFPHKQEAKLSARPCALAMHPEPMRPSALQSWATVGRMKLFKAKLFWAKPLPASLCPLLQRDAGRLCRQAGPLSSRSHSYVWGRGARKLIQAWHHTTLWWHLTEYCSDFVTSISLLSKHILCFCWGAETLLIFSFSALGFSTTLENMVQFYPITLHPWLVCF